MQTAVALISICISISSVLVYAYTKTWSAPIHITISPPQIPAFSADHSSFESWSKSLFGLDRLAFKLDYKNTLSEDVLVVFYLTDPDGNVLWATANHRLEYLGIDAIAEKGTIGAAHAETRPLRAGMYRTSWKAYLRSDKDLSTPIDESASGEGEWHEFRIRQGRGPITHSLSQFKGSEMKEYWPKYGRIRPYRYLVDPEASNSLDISYYDEWPLILAPLLPSKFNPERYFYIFIPSEIFVRSCSIVPTDVGKTELLKTHISTHNLFTGTWYKFKVIADTSHLLYYLWDAKIKFELVNPASGTLPIFVQSSTLEEVIADEILDSIVHTFYEFIASKLTGGSWFSSVDLATFLASIGTDYLASHQVIIMDVVTPQDLQVSVEHDKPTYYIGDNARFTLTVKDFSGDLIDPDRTRAEFNGKSIPLTRQGPGTYIYTTSPLACGLHSFNVKISKSGYKDGVVSDSITVSMKEDANFSKAIEEKKVGASVIVESEFSPKVEIYSPEVDIAMDVISEKVVVKVSSDVPKGKTIVVSIDDETLAVSDITEVLVLFDGQEIPLANNYEDALNPHDDDTPEYLILFAAEGIQILVSIPQFSTKTVTVTKRTTELTIFNRLNQFFFAIPIIGDIIRSLDAIVPNYGSILFILIIGGIFITLVGIARKRRRLTRKTKEKAGSNFK